MRTFILVLSAALLFALAACGGDDSAPVDTGTDGAADSGGGDGSTDSGGIDATVDSGGGDGSTDAGGGDGAADAVVDAVADGAADAVADGAADAVADGAADGGDAATPPGECTSDSTLCTPTCFRPYRCVTVCGGPARECGCCPCAVGSIDDIACP